MNSTIAQVFKRLRRPFWVKMGEGQVQGNDNLICKAGDPRAFYILTSYGEIYMAIDPYTRKIVYGQNNLTNFTLVKGAR